VPRGLYIVIYDPHVRTRNGSSSCCRLRHLHLCVSGPRTHCSMPYGIHTFCSVYTWVYNRSKVHKKLRLKLSSSAFSPELRLNLTRAPMWVPYTRVQPLRGGLLVYHHHTHSKHDRNNYNNNNNNNNTITYRQ